MPAALNAMSKSGMPANLIPPMPKNGARPAPLLPPPPMAPPPVAPPAPAPMPTASQGMPAFPPPSAPAKPPFNLKTQSDGSIAVAWPGPDGNDVISQVFPAPKVPRAFQPPRQPGQ
jgi:hypothetical protein